MTLALAVAAFGLALSPGAASAATITVANTGDGPAGGPDDVGCTLRDAVQAANTNAPVSTCPGDNAGADTIVLQSGKTYTLSQHGLDDNNSKGDLDIAGQTTIKTDGAGLATIDANTTFSAGGPVTGADRAIHVLSSAGAVTLDHLRIENGFVDAGSGFVGGGGILVQAPTTILDSEVVGNQVTGSFEPAGGGIYARTATGILTIDASTIANNKVEGGNEPLGGGIAAYESSPTLTITNSTISGNTVSAGGLAAGILAGDFQNHPVANLTNVTITDNRGEGQNSRGGGIYLSAGTVTGSLIAGNTTDPTYSPEFRDCYTGGTISSGGGNLIGVAGGCEFKKPNDITGTDAAPVNANLGLLLDNGGPTKTLLPNPGSQAINRGGTCPATDQRGFFRASVAPCDAGAVEVGAAAGLKAKLKANRKVKVRNGPHGRFLVLTGIDASCPAAGVKCDGTASVKRAGGSKRLARASKRSKVLGKTKLSVGAGKTKAVKVTLTKKASNALRSAGELKVKISVKLSTLGGKPTVASRKAKLKPPKPKQH